MTTRHAGKVYGHSKGRRPGQKHYYRPVYSGSCWDEFVAAHTIGTLLQVCCGGSFLGRVRVDRDSAAPAVTVVADQRYLPFASEAFDTIACDPIYGLQYPDRIHLQREIARVARSRILFKAPWIPRAAGWTLREPVMGILSHTCANVAIMTALVRNDAHQIPIWRSSS